MRASSIPVLSRDHGWYLTGKGPLVFSACMCFPFWSHQTPGTEDHPQRTADSPRQAHRQSPALGPHRQGLGSLHPPYHRPGRPRARVRPLHHSAPLGSRARREGPESRGSSPLFTTPLPSGGCSLQGGSLPVSLSCPGLWRRPGGPRVGAGSRRWKESEQKARGPSGGAPRGSGRLPVVGWPGEQELPGEDAELPAACIRASGGTQTSGCRRPSGA